MMCNQILRQHHAYAMYADLNALLESKKQNDVSKRCRQKSRSKITPCLLTTAMHLTKASRRRFRGIFLIKLNKMEHVCALCSTKHGQVWVLADCPIVQTCSKDNAQELIRT